MDHTRLYYHYSSFTEKYFHIPSFLVIFNQTQDWFFPFFFLSISFNQDFSSVWIIETEDIFTQYYSAFEAKQQPFSSFQNRQKVKKSRTPAFVVRRAPYLFTAWFYHVSLRQMVVPNRLTHLDVAIKAIWNFLHWITYSCCWKMQSQLLYFCILKELEVVCFLFPYSLIYSRNDLAAFGECSERKGF